MSTTETYHSVQGSCRVCRKVLVLKIADDYDSDALKIVPMATCDECYDIIADIRTCRNSIASWCNKLITFYGIKNDKAKALREKALEGLRQLTREYAGLFATQQKFKVILWDPEFAAIIVEKPQQWGQALKVYHQQARSHDKENA